MELNVSAIDAIAELKHYGVKFEQTGDEWVKVCCPFHNDTSASCGINVKENFFKCHAAGCGKGGNIITFLAGVMKTSAAMITRELLSRYVLKDELSIDASVVERDHAQIWSNGPMLAELRARGVTDTDIQKYRIGVRNDRITIPIKNEVGLFVNVRKYKPGAAGAEKMRNEPRCGKIRLFPIDQLVYPTIVICGGELKAIVAATELNAFNIGAVTTTGGEGNWHPDFTERFKGKKVIVCFDIDDEGQVGARKVQIAIKRSAEWIGNLLLPLDINKYPHGDVNDYVGQEHGSLITLLDSAQEFKWEGELAAIPTNVPPIVVAFDDIMRPNMSDQFVSFNAHVTGVSPSTFHVPHKIVPRCNRDQTFCALCKVSQFEDGTVHEVSKDNVGLLALFGEKDNVQLNVIKKMLEIPKQCAVVDFEIHSRYAIQEIGLSKPTKASDCADNSILSVPGFWFLPDTKIKDNFSGNEDYNFTAIIKPLPKNQQAVALIQEHEPTSKGLSSYDCPVDDRLKIFQPDTWTEESIRKKFLDIYTDLSANVTHIYCRPDMQLLADLTFHSALYIPFNQSQRRGWIESLIIGDSGTGKSTLFADLINFYGWGAKVDCKNATSPGLLAATVKSSTGNYVVSAGAMVQQDRGFIFFDEFGDLNQNIWKQFTEVRSSGKLVVSKAAKASFNARVRLLLATNPPGNRRANARNYGIKTLQELIPSPEDIRRLDIALIAKNTTELSATIDNCIKYPPQVKHTYTQDLCRERVLWAWTRKVEHIKIDNVTIRSIMNWANSFRDDFTDEVPLVDANMALKITKLAVAAAICTYSTDEARQNVIVLPCHVDFVMEELKRIYNEPQFRYGEYSDALKKKDMLDFETVLTVIKEIPSAKSFMIHISHATYFTLDDIQNWSGHFDITLVKRLISDLVNANAIKRLSDKTFSQYEATPAFVEKFQVLLNDEHVKNDTRIAPKDNF